MLTIRDVLQSKSSAIWSICPGDTAYKAMEIMAERDIGVLVVIDEENVVGIVSERDLARNIILKELSPREVLVEELMTKDIYCVTPDMSIEECMGVMTSAHCRHMPVFENNKLIGVITFGDIVKALLLEQKIKIEDLESYASCCDAVSFDDSL
ncbi:MAG TPA: CBS domain-containing protein [Nitrospirae bacterium]|nr:hypoxic response protein 1 [bacterium BMS3Abin06]HDH11504.1 CBS domain-containing protein [Nitrospirota bacterium]HDZ00355.1 CBS domain-containing protein [Nitrospirota bacterium]